MGYVEGLKAELKYCETWATERVDEVKAEIERMINATEKKIDTSHDTSPEVDTSHDASEASPEVDTPEASQSPQLTPSVETAQAPVVANNKAVINKGK